jgi:hemerythrin-like metal-binding protein
MPKIEWSDSLSLGVERVDDQHKRMVKIANTFLESLRQRSEEAVIRGALRDLREYTVYHFHDEEDFMEHIGYPELEDHRREHEKLKGQVKDYQEKIYRRKNIDVEEVRDFLKDWLLGHILDTDMKIAKFLLEREDSENAGTGNGEQAES